MKIEKEHIEWVVVDRLRTMLERTSEDEFDVTHAFALFSSICGWVRQRAGAYASYSKWPSGLDDLKVPITSSAWGLRNEAASGKAWVRLFAGADSIEIDLSKCSAWQFVVWVRNVMAHADDRRVQPIHENVCTSKPHRRLTGFRFGNDECYANLSGEDMRRLGAKLADVFCCAFSESPSFEEDAKQGVLEQAA
ncbi:MAG: hypothetical protein ACE5H8_04765 [Alphaproteobacteria bacterium]